MDVVLLVGLTARLVRLATVDEIGGPARDAARRAGRRVGGDTGLAWADGLVTCPFCIGFWLSAATFTSWMLWGDETVWQAVAAVFTLSYVAGHLSARLDGD